MSTLADKEPSHWHDRHGRHGMRDPRTIPGYPRRHWDLDERRYVAHLEAHEREATTPTPHDDDPEAVTTLFQVIENAEASIRKARDLIIAMRQQAAQRVTGS